MLKFDRKAFVSGVQVVKEPAVVDGVAGELRYVFKPSDKKKDFAFQDEAYVLAKYSHLFTQVVA
jgi:hypothetical protein